MWKSISIQQYQNGNTLPEILKCLSKSLLLSEAHDFPFIYVLLLSPLFVAQLFSTCQSLKSESSLALNVCSRNQKNPGLTGSPLSFHSAYMFPVTHFTQP